MKCPFCGAELMEGISFCTNCGKMLKKASELENVSMEAPIEKTVEEPVVEKTPTVETPVVEKTPAVEEPVVEKMPAIEVPVVEKMPDAEIPATTETPVSIDEALAAMDEVLAASETSSLGTPVAKTPVAPASEPVKLEETRRPAMEPVKVSEAARSETEPVKPAVRPQSNPSVRPKPSASQKPPKKKGKAGKVVLIIAIIVAVLLLCCCGGSVLGIIFLMNGTTVTDTTNTGVDTPDVYTPDTEEATTADEDDSIAETTVYSGSTTPSEAFLDQTAIRFSDDSIMVCKGSNYAWYRSEAEAADYHYRGMYKIYRGQEAFYQIVYEMSDYGITEDELNQYLKRNAGSDLYNLDNLTVMILDNAETKIDGELREGKETRYYGYVNIDLQTGNLVNMDSAGEYTFQFEDYETVCAAIENAIETETSELGTEEITEPDEKDTEVESMLEDTTEDDSLEAESTIEDTTEDDSTETESETEDVTKEDESQQGTATDWKTLGFRLNDELMDWPIDWTDIEATGFVLPSNWDTLDLDEDEYSFLSAAYNEDDQTSIMISLKNFGRGNESKPARDCEVYSIRFEENGDRTPYFELLTGISLGSTRDEVEAIYGLCDMESEDSNGGTVNCRYEVTPGEHYSNIIEFTYEDDFVTSVEITNYDDNLK